MVSSAFPVRLFGKSSPKIRWIMKPKHAVRRNRQSFRQHDVVVRRPTFRYVAAAIELLLV